MSSMMLKQNNFGFEAVGSEVTCSSLPAVQLPDLKSWREDMYDHMNHTLDHVRIPSVHSHAFLQLEFW